MEWFQETLHPAIRQTLKVDEVLHRDKTALQDLVIFRNPTFGRVMALDGIVQTTEGDEYIYHEMLAHVPILAVKAAKGRVGKVLIVGGGDGGCIREVLKHKGFVCTMVEIDESVIDLSRKHLPNHHAGAFKKLFKEGGCYLAVVPTYNGGFMALGWATDNLKLRKTPVAKIARLYKAAKLDTRYFTPELFAGAFALPAFIQKIVDAAAPKKAKGKAKR